MLAYRNEEERGSYAAQMEKLPQDHWLPGLGGEMTLWEAHSLPGPG